MGKCIFLSTLYLPEIVFGNFQPHVELTRHCLEKSDGGLCMMVWVYDGWHRGTGQNDRIGTRNNG